MVIAGWTDHMWCNLTYILKTKSRTLWLKVYFHFLASHESSYESCSIWITQCHPESLYPLKVCYLQPPYPLYLWVLCLDKFVPGPVYLSHITQVKSCPFTDFHNISIHHMKLINYFGTVGTLISWNFSPIFYLSIGK